MFDISIERRGQRPAGTIVIGDFHAEFAMVLGYWAIEDYRASWARSAAAVLGAGFGRFLVSVGAPGTLFETWPCWVRCDACVLHKSMLLGSLSRDFASTSDGETHDLDFPHESEKRGSLNFYRCGLADIAEFERRVRGGGVQ